MKLLDHFRYPRVPNCENSHVPYSKKNRTEKSKTVNYIIYWFNAFDA